MKLTKMLVWATFPFFYSVQTLAQLPDGVTDNGEIKFNHIKVNLPGLFINNYSLQYERVLNKKSGMALSFRFMPENKLPFQSAIKKAVANQDAELQRTVDRLRISNFAITPEYRFYLGQGYGRGFYIAPFYRYAKFKSNNILITYTADFLGNEENVNLSGDLSSHTFGLLFGAQWVFGNAITVDWQIAGPHFGAGHGNFAGVSSRPLSASDQQRVREELQKLDIPFTKKTIATDAQGATMKLDGPWGGVRAGLSVGFNF
jgi:hypothetical protein